MSTRPHVSSHVIVGVPLVPSHSTITDESERSTYWARLMDLLEVPARLSESPTFFPCCNPRSISTPTSGVLATHEFCVSLKSDGVRYLLLLTLRPHTHGPVALMIDRSRNMYEIEVVAPDRYFVEGTVLEGELVWLEPDRHTRIFQVFDALRVRGEVLTRLPFRTRLERAAMCVRLSEDVRDLDDAAIMEADSIVIVHYEPRIEVRVKHFVSCEHAARMWNERRDVNHRVDGIILQAVDAPYSLGSSSDTCLKWKEHSSVDLLGRPPHLYTSDGRQLPKRIEGRNLCIPQTRVHVNDTTIAEYYVHVSEKTIELTASRTRPDKNSPNSLYVVRATILDVIHAMTPDDITRQCRSHTS